MFAVFPNAWGWSEGCIDFVFPTRVGMVRRPSIATRLGCRAFSPHAWGWSDNRVGPGDASELDRFPHTRGDGPDPVDAMFSPHAWGWSELVRARRAFSPHAWGWSVTRRCSNSKDVFPTRVGMVRHNGSWNVFPTRVGMVREAGISFPHTRGDGPRCPCVTLASIGFPHTRGDGPFAGTLVHPFSPHAWGWSVTWALPDRFSPHAWGSSVGPSVLIPNSLI